MLSLVSDGNVVADSKSNEGADPHEGVSLKLKKHSILGFPKVQVLFLNAYQFFNWF